MTSVSVIMDDGSGSKTYFADAAGKPVPRPSINSQVASPINLLNPDRYEFYTFDDTGDLVKRLMTLDEIQGIIAGGDGDATLYSDDQTLADTADLLSIHSQSPELRVKDVVANIQSVMKGEMEQQKKHTTLTKPMLDTPDVSATWSMILPAIFGNTGGDIIPEKHPQVIMTPETEVVDTATSKSNSTEAQSLESREPITYKNQQIVNTGGLDATSPVTTANKDILNEPVSIASDFKDDIKNYTLIAYSGTTDKYSTPADKLSEITKKPIESITYEKINIDHGPSQNSSNVEFKPLNSVTTSETLNKLSDKNQSASENTSVDTNEQTEEALKNDLYYTVEYIKPSSESPAPTASTSETDNDTSNSQTQQVIFDHNSKPSLYSANVIKPLHQNISTETPVESDLIQSTTQPIIVDGTSEQTKLNTLDDSQIFITQSTEADNTPTTSKPKIDNLVEESKIVPTVLDSTTNRYESETKTLPAESTSIVSAESTSATLAQSSESDEIIKTESTQTLGQETTFSQDSYTESVYTKKPYQNSEELYSTTQQLYTIPVFDILKLNVTKNEEETESSTQNQQTITTEKLSQTQTVEVDSDTSKFTTVTSYQEVTESAPKQEFIINAGSLENDYSEEQSSTFTYNDYYKTTNNEEVSTNKDPDNHLSSVYTTSKIPTTEYDAESTKLETTQTSSPILDKSTNGPSDQQISSSTEFGNPSTTVDDFAEVKLSTTNDKDISTTNIYTEQDIEYSTTAASSKAPEIVEDINTTEKSKEYSTTVNSKAPEIVEDINFTKEDSQTKSEAYTKPTVSNVPNTEQFEETTTLKQYSLSDIMGSVFTNMNNEPASTSPESDSFLLPSLQESLSNVLFQVSDDSSDTSVPLIHHSETTTTKHPLKQENDDQITYETSVVKETSSVSMEAGKPENIPQYNEYHSSESSSTEEISYDSQSSEENYPPGYKIPSSTRKTDSIHTQETSQKPTKNKFNDDSQLDSSSEEQTQKTQLTSSEEYPANIDQYQGFGTRIATTTTPKYFTTQTPKINRYETTKYYETSTPKNVENENRSPSTQGTDSSIIMIKTTTERIKNNKGEGKPPSTIYAHTYNTGYKVSNYVPLESSTYHLKLNLSSANNDNIIHLNTQINTGPNTTKFYELQYDKADYSPQQDNILNESKNEDVSTTSNIKVTTSDSINTPVHPSTTETIKNSDATSMKSNPRITTEYENNDAEFLLSQQNALNINLTDNASNVEHVLKDVVTSGDIEKTTLESENINTTQFIINADEIDYTTQGIQAVEASTNKEEYSSIVAEHTVSDDIKESPASSTPTFETSEDSQYSTEKDIDEATALYASDSPYSTSLVEEVRKPSTISYQASDATTPEGVSKITLNDVKESTTILADEQNVNEYYTTTKNIDTSLASELPLATIVDSNDHTTEIKNTAQETGVSENILHFVPESTVRPEDEQTSEIQENSSHVASTTNADNFVVTSGKPTSADLQADTSDILIMESNKNKTHTTQTTFANEYVGSTTVNDSYVTPEDEKWKLVTSINSLESISTKLPIDLTTLPPQKIENTQSVYHTIDTPNPPQAINEEAAIEPVRFSSSPKENLGLLESTAGLSEDISEFADLCNELAFKYWQAVTSKGISPSRGLVISPFAVTSLLAMMFMGARGATSEEMNEILKLDDMVTFNPHLVFKNVTESIEVNKRSGVATSAFVRELFSDRTKVKLLGFYKQRAQQFYGGHVEEVNYNVINDIVRRRTNLLVKRQTWDKIPEYLKSNVITLRPPLAALSANIFQVKYLNYCYSF